MVEFAALHGEENELFGVAELLNILESLFVCDVKGITCLCVVCRSHWRYSNNLDATMEQSYVGTDWPFESLPRSVAAVRSSDRLGNWLSKAELESRGARGAPRSRGL